MDRLIDDFLEKIRSDGRTQNTVAAYRNDLRQFHAYLRAAYPAVHGWTDVESRHIAAFLTHLHSAGRSPSSLARKKVALGRFLDHLGMETHDFDLSDSLLQALKREARTQPLPKPTLSRETIDQLLAQPSRHQTPSTYRDQALLSLLCNTDIRATELVMLNVDDINLTAKEIVIAAGSKGERHTLLDDHSVAMLADYLRQRKTAGGQPLFLNQWGQRLTRQGVWLIVRTHAAAIGFQDQLSPRSLRQAARARLHQKESAEQERPSLVLDGVRVTTR